MGHPADLSECSCSRGRTVALGVDVGADRITAVLADGRGHVISSLERPVPGGCGPDGLRLAEEIAGVIDALRASTADELLGQGSGGEAEDSAQALPALVVGVCVPGVVDENEGWVRHSDALGLQDVALASLVSRSLATESAESAGSVKVVLYQEARCGAWAESRWGAGGESCLYLTVGAGISCAVLLDGVPVLGGGWAGQVGRVLVSDPDWSGERARLEDVASVDAMVGRYTAGIVDDSVDGPADDSVDGPGGAASIASPAGSGESDVVVSVRRTGPVASGLDALLSAMRSGDREARRVWDTGLDALADLIARGVGLLGPLDVVVGSELTRAGEAVFLEPLRLRVADLMAGLPVPSLLPARLGKPASALGAAGRALNG
ncbi:ROK family protein [Actinomyces sp. ZJ308]|uniref:ROK family protein n=1 Tax=Actinomyces sp. ZJ308 TaxID=2708342 RepID=UPI00141E3200|nr:ROK family protein [Actinomyces sp. ZJ308]